MITWHITGLDAYPERDGEEQVVCTAHWRCVASDGVNAGEVYASAQFSPEPTGEFVPYNSLTEETVLGWVWSVVDRASAEAAAKAALDRIVNPPVISPALPWSNSP